MLATALDVYFSDQAFGGNWINAPSSIGGQVIDLTKICTDLTCTAYQDVSSAFDGSSSLMVSELLTSAADNSDLGGIFWYSNDKATQELAKDTFDAINNQKAFN